ncbi:MAG: GAF domain-containing protein [Candidatus Tectomicrobia bacterium]|nr:GAF domain-containing protein [Candidatus Tectomicrobia bacterium]
MSLPITLLYVDASPDSLIEQTLEQLQPDYRLLPTLRSVELLSLDHDENPLLLLVDQQLCLEALGKITSLKSGERPRPFALVPIIDAEKEASLEEHSFANPYLGGYLTRPVRPPQLRTTLRLASDTLRLKAERLALQQQVTRQEHAMHELNRIGTALSSEHNLDTLLEKILRLAREITVADAGSLYLIDEIEGMPADEKDFLANKRLRFTLAQNDTRPVPYQQFTMPINRQSIAGFVSITGAPENIQDCYELPPGCEFSINRSFDESTGYRTKSMLVVPMRNQKNESIGVLQLINRKKSAAITLDTPEAIAEAIIPFDAECEELAYSLSSQAAIAIENALLYEEIQKLFEGFIRASVTAIEARDPTTSGHSTRVAILTVALAEQVDRLDRGPYRDVHFTPEQMKEINYASLLHDFGKIGVREPVLVKAKKLYPNELELLSQRYCFLRKAIELDVARRKLHCLQQGGAGAAPLAALDAELQAKVAAVNEAYAFILQVNEPTVLPATGFEKLSEIANQALAEPEGSIIPYLTEREYYNLSISKGSLNPEERLEIESHVTHTYNFLSKIPWTRELRQVPEIAYAHHEKLDGSGYPRSVIAGVIPPQARMMTIADIYDALTARDRPYKRAIPPERALSILEAEMKSGHLDPDLFQLFLETRIYDLVGGEKEGGR